MNYSTHSFLNRSGFIFFDEISIGSEKIGYLTLFIKNNLVITTKNFNFSETRTNHFLLDTYIL